MVSHFLLLNLKQFFTLPQISKKAPKRKGSDLAPYIGDLSQSEKLYELKQPLVKQDFARHLLTFSVDGMLTK